MPAGRPTEYTPELVEKAWKYADGGWKRAGDKVPSVAGLACVLGVRRETCHAWGKDDDKEFSNILGVIAEKQERELLNKGLSGDFNSPITKMMLSKHGYADANTFGSDPDKPLRHEVSGTEKLTAFLAAKSGGGGN